MKIKNTAFKSLLAPVLGFLTVAFLGMLPMRASADWVVDGDSVYFTDYVGYTEDGSAFSGTVALRMDNVVVSGRVKILTTILSITPEPGSLTA